jgi:hypothetical protein
MTLVDGLRHLVLVPGRPACLVPQHGRPPDRTCRLVPRGTPMSCDTRCCCKSTNIDQPVDGAATQLTPRVAQHWWALSDDPPGVQPPGRFSWSRYSCWRLRPQVAGLGTSAERTGDEAFGDTSRRERVPRRSLERWREGGLAGSEPADRDRPAAPSCALPPGLADAPWASICPVAPSSPVTSPRHRSSQPGTSTRAQSRTVFSRGELARHAFDEGIRNVTHVFG